VVSEQHLLSYLASGYLLNNHNIRVAPTLANKTVIRVEPSAYISEDSCEQFCHALGQFLTHLRDGDTARLLGFMVGRRIAIPHGPINPQSSRRTTKAASSIGTPARVAFLVHFSTISDLQNWEPRLQAFSETDCASFLHRTRGLFDPFVLHETQVNSRVGNRVHLTVIGIPFTAAQAIESMRDGSECCLDSVKQGVELARELGCTVVGLGGYTSIVSNSGRSLVEDVLALTSGNSLSVAAAHESLLKAAARVGLDIGTCRLGVVGAAGNLGATLAELTADEVGSMLLIGRPNGKRFLQQVAERIYAAALGRIAGGFADTGIARAIANSNVVRDALRTGKLESERLGENLFFSLSEEMGEEAPIQLGTTLDDLRSCQLVISATNAARPVVNSSHLSDGPIVVCDIAVPRDVDLAVESERPRATVIRGGMVYAPLGQVLGIPAMPLREGELYGCLAETILLGFVGCQEHYSYGPLSVSRVRQVREWAAIHGLETVTN
jgi:predicted amino acid dehydrogenase